jgi:hypothetical protein
MSRGPDAATLLAVALVASSDHADCPIVLGYASQTRWASATFTGARHLITLAAEDTPAFSAWLYSLPEAEFALRGHLVADLSLEWVEHDGDVAGAVLEVLTVEER